MRTPILSQRMKDMSYTADTLTSDINRTSTHPFSPEYIEQVLRGELIPSMALALVIKSKLQIKGVPVQEVFPQLRQSPISSDGKGTIGSAVSGQCLQSPANTQSIRQSVPSRIR